MKAERKWIDGYEGLYEAHSNGRIWSAISGKYFSDHKKNYYKTVTLCKNLIKTSFSLHRLIAIAFVPNPENRPCINHKNGKKWDNRPENLEWTTNSENLQHAYDTGLKNVGYGESNHMYGRTGLLCNRKKTVLKIDPISDKILEQYITMTEAAKNNNVVVSAISNCCKGLSITSAGFKWKYN